jgi:MFS family permease
MSTSVAARLDRIPPFKLHRRMERYARKHLIVASALAMAAFGLLFGVATASWLIMVAGFVVTSASNVFSNGFHVYQAELFPTRTRATAVDTAYSLSRLSGAILPFITVTVLDRVDAGGRTWWGNCAWDAFGIVAALDLRDATITAQAITLGPEDDDAVFGVLVPAAHWWDDIAFT